MAEEVVVLDATVSVFGMRVRIALAVKGVQFEYKRQDLKNKSELLLKMNPVDKKFPVLIHNGKPICESLNIVECIDEVWNDRSPLLPSDPYLRAQARFRAAFVDKKHEAAKGEFFEIIKTLEEELGDKPYFGGETLGFLDVAFVPYYTWFCTCETFGKFSMEKECPKTHGLKGACKMKMLPRIFPTSRRFMSTS